MNNNNNKKLIFSLDCETNGLRGQIFAIAYTVTEEETGKEIENKVFRCDIQGEVVPFVAENVLITMKDIKITHGTYKSMIEDFSKDYFEYKNKGAKFIVHMGYPVETGLFDEMYKLGFMGEFEAPYPLIDISAFPEINTSVDTYNAKHNISEEQGETHNPLFDCRQTTNAYLHILK